MNSKFDTSKPTILLNSHHDTVKPNESYTRNPYLASIEDGKLYGLGSNDAGGSLVALIAVYIHFNSKTNLPFNIIFAASAEEENSGKNGFESIIAHLPKINLAIVGEPTCMKLAIAEKGLLVIDAISHGIAGHVAHSNTINAITSALKDIETLNALTFEKKSNFLGDVKLSVTQIYGGKQHNVVPDTCSFVIDVRINDCYSNQEVFDIIQSNIQSTLKARSFHLNPSSIPIDHSIVNVANKLDIPLFGSNTLSDQALMPFPSVKIGPGDSIRSHTADEFIYVDEIKTGIKKYIHLINNLANETLG
jgi:acetylornithine deacetylase